MKTKRICKSTVSLILAFMMLVSMFTVGIVSTSAAETDVAETGATGCYLKGDFNSWGATNEFTESSGTYSVTLTIPAGSYGFKVDANGTYYGCNTTINDTANNFYFYTSAGNCTFNSSGGSFTFSYHKSNNDIVLSVKKNSGGSTDATIYLPGGFNGWSTTGDTAKFTKVSGTNYKYEVSLAQSTTYEFKVHKDGTWMGNKGIITDTVTSANGWIFDSNVGDNCKITTKAAGTYVFNFDSSSNKLSVEYPAKPVETEPPTNPSGTTTTTIYLKDSVTSWEIEGDDAKFFAIGNDNVVHEMKQTIDTISGSPLWYAENVATSNTTITFYRTSYFFDESNAKEKPWNTWTASSRSTKTVYNVTGNTGSWVTTTVKPANLSSSDNFWYGLWVDTKKDLNTKTFVRTERSGSVLSLYLPSYVDLTDIDLYSSFKTSSITGGSYSTAKSLTQGSPTKVTLQTGVDYTLTTTNDNDTAQNFTLKVYTTSNTASMLMTTEEELFTGKTAGLGGDNAWPSGSGINGDNFNNIYKDAIETKGSIYVFGEDGTLVNGGDGETKLKKIKGRGNSSFKGSMQVYGKYAYNFNLDKKIDLTKRSDGSHASTASKKWCLLANNPDITMMRNTLIYSLADDVGLKYGPETRLVDAYDNGKYLGAFIITEKVEYGKNTLMGDLKSLDDGNTDANSVPHPTDEDEDPLYEFDTDDLNAGTEKTTAFSGTNYTYKYYTTYNRPAYKDVNGNTVAAANNLEYKSPDNYNTKYNYLLEFELYDRYKNEASWFVSSRTGQAVVVKYPEFATKAEMEWIISEYEKAEAAIYTDNTDAIKAAVDVDSFARMYLIQELAINLDSGATSYYIHNRFEEDGTSKLYASPVWDYDWSLGAYAKDLKYIYNGSSVTTSSNMSDPKQMFVKNKALKTDSGDNTKKSNYNFQAKLVHNAYAWERCQYYWTNLFVPNLERYVDNDYTDATSQKDDGKAEGRMLTEWLPTFRSSLAMNDARWGSVTFTGDDWGTKVTTDYVNRSFDFKVGNCGTSGSATKSYDNSVYYLNDWVVTRWNYMSSSTGGNLFREDLKETIKAENATFTGLQDGSKLEITPSVEITYNGDRVDDDYPELITYDIYVNGKKTATNTLNNKTVISLESGIESYVYIVAYLTNAPNTKATSPTQKFSYGVSTYKVENVAFTGEQHDGVITITPSAKVTKDGEEVMDPNAKEYTVYVNGVAAVTKTFAAGSANVNIPEGQVSKIYIKVNPTGVTGISGTSITQEFSFNVKVETIEVTLNFKSSTSYRYIPKIDFNGEMIDMDKDVLIGKNNSQTQTYYWYKKTVEIPKNVETKISFVNAYSMNATVTLKLTEATELFYGVDNLNNGATAVDLTAFNTNDAKDQLILNFKQSATHMVYNDANDPELATTSINGKIKKVGDANEDNKLNISDATAIQRSLAELDTLTEIGSALADFNLDSTASIMDATSIQIKLTN